VEDNIFEGRIRSLIDIGNWNGYFTGPDLVKPCISFQILPVPN
jgi:hypothetical protein